MADQADGSIIIDTEINSDGFKAGSAELLAAIKALSTEVKNLGQTLKELFSKPLTPEINTGGAEDKVAALEAKVQELQASLEELQNTNGSGTPAPETATPQVNIGGVTEKASGLQREIDAVNSSVQKLEPTFQKAMSGSESAMTSFEGKASTLESKIAELQERLDAVGQTQFPTQEYAELCAETEKAGQKLESLLNKQEKMQALGVSENSAQWKNLQYDLDLTAQKYDRLEAAKAKMEASGTAFQAGVDTTQYAQMESTLSAAAARLDEMRAGTQQSESLMSRLASSARNVASFIGRAAKSAAGALVSGIKAAASGMAKMLFHSKKMNSQFGGLISGAKKFALSLLGARGVWALLRKAVSAYMAENQQLSNTLSACWSGIGNLLGPIITRIINLVAQAVAYVTAFLKLFGLYGKTASKEISSAGGAASKATDKLKRQLAAFDELNILSDNSSDGGGGGGGAGDLGSLPDVTLPDWAKLMVEQIKAGDWAAAANTLATKLNSMIAGVDWAGVGDKIGYYLNGALTFLATAILTFDWYALGADLATSINHIIYSVDWANLGVVLGAKFIILIEGLGGLFATIDWAALGKALADAFMGLWNAIDWVQAAKTLSDGIIGALNALSTAIKNVDWQKLGHDVATFIANIDWTGVADALFDGIGAALGGIAAFLWGLIEDAWNSVVDWWHENALEDGEFTMAGLLEGIWNGIKNIGTWIYEHIFKPFIDGFKAAFGIASPSTVMAEQGDFIVQGLLQGITNAWHAITEFFSTALSSICDAVSNAWSSIKSWTSTAWNNVKTTIGGAWDKVKSKTSEICSNVGSKVSSAWESVKSKTSSVWSNVKTNISNAWSNVKSAATSGWTSVKNGVSTAWNNVKSTTTSVWNGVKSSLSSTWNSVKTTASSTWTNLKTTVSNGWNNIKANTSTVWNGVKATLSSTWGNIKSTASSTWNSMKATASSAWNSMKSTASSTWSNIKSSLSSTWNSIKSTASSTWSGIKNAIQNQGWSGVGSNICNGIANGINSGWSWLKNKVSSLASSLLSAAKSALGIHSPSRLFRDEIGLNIGYGVGEGVEASQPSILKSVSGVADAIADEFNAGDYKVGNIVPTSEVDGALSSFSDKISGSFTSLLDRLQAIADNITFAVPAVAGGVVPYKTAAAAASGGGADIGTTIETSNDALASVVTQVVMNATNAIVTAIQNYSGTTVNLDKAAIAEMTVKEINRRTRATGKSPLE
jgi:phage-related protein